MVTVFILIAFGFCNRIGNDDLIINNDIKTAEKDIRDRGYVVVKTEGEIDKYTLDKNKIYGEISTTPYQQIWGLQNIDALEYFGNEITVYKFIVKNHPLEKQYSNSKNGIELYYMLSDGVIIGGYSYPNSNIAGSFSSLEGKSIEEVTGLTFNEWEKAWREKYSN